MVLVAERRACARITPDPGLMCLCTSAEFLGRSRDQVNVAVRLLEVSLRGARVVTTSLLRERAPVVVDLTAPRLVARFKAHAVVRWSRHLPVGRRVVPVAGLRFDRVLESMGDRSLFMGGRNEPLPAPRDQDPQRAFRRFRLRDAKIVCSPRDLWRSLGVAPHPDVRLMDVSRGGAQVVSSKKLEAGGSVDVSIRIAPAGAPIAAEAEVRWCRRDTLSLEPRWRAGLAFLRMSPQDECRLRALEPRPPA